MLSDQSLQFYLQAEDRLTPVLRKADTSYDQLTRSMEKSNKRVYRAATAGTSQFARMLDGVRKAPKTIEQAFKDVHKILSRRAKPINQPINLVVAKNGQKGLEKVVASAIGRALSGAHMRLSASKDVPKPRSPLFDTKVGLRSAYKNAVQPPDFQGFFDKLPKFSKGSPAVGMPSPPPGEDVLAWLRKGEAVVPKTDTDEIRKALRGSGRGKDVVGSLNEIVKLTQALKNLDAHIAQTPGDQKAMATREFGQKKLTSSLGGIGSKMSELSPAQVLKLSPALVRVTQDARDYEKAMLAAAQATGGGAPGGGGGGGDGGGGGGGTGLSFAVALATLSNELRDMSDRFNQVGDTESIDSFIDNLNMVNRTLDLSRTELKAFKQDMVTATGRDGLINMTMIGESVEALAESGFRASESFRTLGPIVATTAQQTGLSFNEVSDTLLTLTRYYGQSEQQAARFFSRQRQLAKGSLISMQSLTALTRELTESADGYLAFLGPDTSEKVMTGLNGIAAGVANITGQPFAEDIARTLSSALGGDIESRSTIDRIFARAGMNFEDVRKSLESGDLSAVQQGMASFAQSLADQIGPITSASERMMVLKNTAEALGLDAQRGGAGLAYLAKEGLNTANVMQRTTRDADKVVDGLAELSQGAENTQTFFQQMRNQIGNTFAGVFGASVLDFFKEFNPVVLLSSLYIGQLAAGLAGKLLPALKSVGGLLGGGIGKLLGLGGKGAAASVASSGATAAQGGGIGLFMTGLAQGFKAFATPQVIGGVAVITGALLGVAYAAKLATPAIHEVVVGMVDIVGTMSGMDPTQILATTGALLAFGPSLATIGVGLATLSVGMLAAIPGLTAFMAFNKVVGIKSTGSVLGDTVNALVSSFQVDNAKVDKAVAGVTGAVKFLSGFAATAALMGTLAVGSMGVHLMGKVSDALGFFGLAPMTSLADDSRSISNNIMSMVDGFQPLATPGFVRKIEATSGVVEAVANFAADYARIVGSVSMITPKDGWIMDVARLFYRDAPLSALTAQASDIKTTVLTLSESFAGMDVPATMAQTTETVAALARFATEYATVTTKLSEVAPKDGVLAVAWNWWFNSPDFAALADNAPMVASTVNALATTFQGVNASGAAKALTSTQAFGQFVAGLVPMYENLGKLTAASDALDVADNGAEFQQAIGNAGTVASLVKTLIARFGAVTVDDAALTAIEGLKAYLMGVSGVYATLAGIGADRSLLSNASRGVSTVESLQAKMAGIERGRITQQTDVVTAQQIEIAKQAAIEVVSDNSPLVEQVKQSNILLAQVAQLLTRGMHPVVNVNTGGSTGSRRTSRDTDRMVGG